MLLLEFCVVFAVLFGTLMAVWRPAPERIAVHTRFQEIRSRRASATAGAESAAGLAGLLKAETKRSSWMERLLDTRWAERLRVLLVQSGSRGSVGSVLAAVTGTSIVAGGVSFVASGSVAVALAAGTACGGAPIALLAIRRTRRLAAFEKALPDAVEMMARSLRAGHSMAAAMVVVAEHAAAPVAAEFAEVSRKGNFGVPLREALLGLVERVPSQDLRVVVTGMLVQKDTGGNLAEVLSRIVAVVRERARVQGEVRTHTAQGRMTGWILCGLPPVLILIINVANPGYSNVLFHEPAGRRLLWLGLGLLAVGAMWIRSIVQSIEV